MSDKYELPLRSEVDIKDTWDLTPMFKDDDAWNTEFDAIQNDLSEVAAYRGTLTKSAESLLAGLKFRDELSYRIEFLYVYAHLSFDVDTTNPKYQAMNARVQSLLAQFGSSFSFYEAEILSADEAVIREYLESNDALSLYNHEFDRLFKSRPHILSEKEERILASSGEIFGVSSQTFGMLNNADIQFPTIKDESGNDVQLSHGRYSLLMESADRRVREDAFKAMQTTYGNLKNTLASTLSGNVKVHNFNATIRNYASARQAALAANNIDEEVYDSLLEGIHNNINLLHDYVALREEALGIDDIQMYDIYVPMVDEVDLKFTYEEAQEVILDALSVLGEEYCAVLKRAFDERWIDVVENKGKRSGAYSSGTYGSAPYILLNWQENIDNVFTLAHELGHSVHSYFTRKYQPYIYGDYSIFVAEVASTTNENLLLNYLLDQYEDPKVRAYLLNHYLDTVKGTVFRQTQFAEFEHLIHKSDQEGVALTADYLIESYYKLNQFYYGESISTEEIGYEWARIPHFYYNYYVYQYATGFSAATLFSETIYNGGDATPYLDFLKSGSSDYPINVLRKAGVDMTESTAVDTTLEKFGERMAELRTLLVK
ncbi:oligoendopeptidase F [Erysipelothrix amsterdamensis]|uniref:Oligopeptidase F n=1 Tax=Erysipelothrix amsterdamensis TaxID=2929157 RepID=A0AAU9VHS1_9FIRM|nr:oligoendopeptidase F [Erysipelothrix sp. 4322-04]WRB86350.1 oligoendopeptidase F [Erysipelothrix sp. 4322-04]CAH2761357.1 oligoendopeptidase F [Erysipelothrix sp. A18Y020d]CAH2761358.1 oligoendopeptidase F [Erysipelothrix sp. A18Y020d]